MMLVKHKYAFNCSKETMPVTSLPLGSISTTFSSSAWLYLRSNSPVWMFHTHNAQPMCDVLTKVFPWQDKPRGQMKYNRYRSEVVEGKCIPDSNVITFIRILSSRTVMIIRNCYNDRSIRCSCGVAALIQQATKSMVPPIFQMRVCWFPQKRNAIFQSFLPFFIPKIISYERFASTAPPSTSESACSMHLPYSTEVRCRRIG